MRDTLGSLIEPGIATYDEIKPDIFGSETSS